MTDVESLPAHRDPASWDIPELVIRFVRAVHELERCHPKQESGLSMQQLRALLFLVNNDESTIKELAQALSISEARASRLADELTSAGKLYSMRNPADRRQVRLHVTPAAAEKARRIFGERVDALRAAIVDTPTQDVEAFMNVFGRIVEEFEALAQRTAPV